jgi:hypothetical protein
VEYAIPLDTARGPGGGGTGDPGNAGVGSPGDTSGHSNRPTLFGSGITPRHSSSPRSKRTSGAHSGSRRKGVASSGGSGSRGAGVAPVITASAGYSSDGPLAAVIVAILVAGGAIGLAARLRARRALRSGPRT